MSERMEVPSSSGSSERVETLAEVIRVLAGKESDLVLTFEDLTLDILGGREEAKPRLSMKLSGSIKLDVAYVKE